MFFGDLYESNVPEFGDRGDSACYLVMVLVVESMPIRCCKGLLF